MIQNYILQYTSKMDAQSLIPIVTFGKRYNGKPVTELLKDTEYLEWCMKQPWFKKYTNIYNICVNQTITTTNSDSRTPEHNRLQNLFLNKDNQDKILKYLNKSKYRFDACCEFEGEYNWDVILDNVTYTKWKGGCGCEDCNDECYYDNDRNEYPHSCVFIEIKTLIGEDYPCVFRKMKLQKELSYNRLKKEEKEFIHDFNNRCGIFEHYDREDRKESVKNFNRSNNRFTAKFVLLVKSFVSTNTSKEEFVQIFKNEGIRVVFFNEVFGEDVVSMEEKTSEEKPYISNQIEDSENMILREKLFQAEQKIKELEEEIFLLKKPKNIKTIQHYFTKT